MNDEERQAIERLRKYQKAVITEPTLIDAIEIILNFIKKQQEEIEVYKDIKELAGIEIRDILNWKYENKRLKSEIEKKDKIIDEMAKVLADYKYEEIICMEVDCEHIELQNEGTCIGDKACIKEYFKKKVEGK